MEIKQAFANALKVARKSRGLTQEDFALVSSRTYLSTLERGLKAPTLEKIDALSGRLGIHPLTLLTLTYLQVADELEVELLLERIAQEVNVTLMVLGKEKP